MALPAGTTVINGFALTPDGALYVTTDPASAITGTTITATTRFLAGDGAVGAPSYSFSSDLDTGIFRDTSSGGVHIAVDGASLLAAYGGGALVPSTGTVGWSANSTITAAGDLFLVRDAAGILAQRNGANAQTFRVYTSYTDGSNYEGGQLTTGAGGVYLQGITVGNGTDTIDIFLNPTGSGRVKADSPIIASNIVAMPAGGSSTVFIGLSSTAGFGIFAGSGAPTLSAAKGSIYLRTDGSSTATRLYINTDAGTTWTNVVTGI